MTNPNTKKAGVVSISRNNSKMGFTPSVSLPPVITCNPSAPCFAKCYAVHMIKGPHGHSIKPAWQNNLEIFKHDPDGYFLQIQAAAVASAFFRWHVGGDIPNYDYFLGMVATARKVKKCQFLAFTKQHEIINKYLDEGHRIPRNLTIIFSNWFDWKCNNPHGLPVCEIFDKDNPPARDAFICGGSCSECQARGVGCWQLKNGQTIAIKKH